MSNYIDLLQEFGHKSEDEENLRFYQVPKVLFSSDRYKGLSMEAKMAYGILRDRQELSRKNNWEDENGYLYFIFTNKNLEEIFECGKNKVINIKKELEKYELLVTRQMGLGKPNRMYILKPNYSKVDTYKKNNPVDKLDTSSYPQAQTLDTDKKSLNQTSRSPENKLQEVYIKDTNDTEVNDTDSIDTQSINKKEKNERLTDRNPLEELSKNYDSEIITIALQKTNQAKENGTVINNLYAYLKTICEEVKTEQEVLSNTPNRKHKTKFHTEEQRSDKYSADELEDVAKRKRREYIKRMNEANG